MFEEMAKQSCIKRGGGGGGLKKGNRRRKNFPV